MKTENDVVFLKGKRVNLRPVKKEDAKKFFIWMNDPEIREFVSRPFPVLEKDEENWIEGLIKKKNTDALLVIETIKGEAIGVIGLHGINWINRTCTTGTVIGEKKYWSRGLGSEAKMLILDYAFDQLNLRKIISEVISFNGRSRRYSHKCGYIFEGKIKSFYYRNGRFWDKIILSVTRKNWLPIWEKYKKTGKV